MTTVEKLKAKILDLAIRGKLVPQDPNDEPASVLLERIKAEKAKLVKAKKIKKDKNPSEIVVGADGATYEKFEDGKSKDISDELPFDLPQGWAWARLGDVSQSISSKPYQILESAILSEGKYPVVSQGKCRIDGYCNAEDKALTEVPLVLFGDHTRAVKYIDFPFVVGADGTKLFRPYINSKWLYYWTCHAALIQLDSRGYGRHWILLNQLLIPLPPLYEQKRIVAKAEELFTYADTIGESSEGVARTAERIDKKILDLAIRGQLMPQDQGDEPASELLKRLEAAKRAKAGGRVSSRAASDRPAYEIDPPFDIPDSWAWVKFGTLIQVIAGVSYQKDDVTTTGVRILRGGNIKEDARIYLHDDDVFLPATYAEDITSVKAGDIVVVASTGSSTVIGRPAVATETMIGVQIGAFLRIVRAVDDSIMSWLPVVFLGDYYRNFIRSRSKGTNIKNLKTEYLTELPVPLPPLAEQKRIVTKIKELRAMTKSLTT